MIGTCIAVAAAVGGVSVTASAGTAIKTAEAATGQLDCELELNGKVESLSEKTYFADINPFTLSGKVGLFFQSHSQLTKLAIWMVSV